MNIFQLIGDMMHLASILILLLKIHTSRSAAGISFKSQLLYAVVFCTRYLDLFLKFSTLYLTLMKTFFILSSFGILYLMKIRFKASWDPALDTFKIEYLFGGAGLLAIFVHYRTVFDVIEASFDLQS
eukprot:jgi/Hompol1/4325/HPOL_007050-RA